MHPFTHSRALRRAAVLATVTAVAASGIAASGIALGALPAAAAPTPASSAGECQSVTSLTNGGFESPVIPDASYRIIPAADVDGWETTDPAGIEIWSNGFYGVPASAGRQFAELNATQTGTLFQEVATRPGQSLRWSLLHRGRGGVDVMDVLIGSPSGTLESQGNLSDGTSAWGRHSGIYTVPAGQTVTRFGFRAVTTGSGSASIGNFLDDISFGTGACVVVTSDVANLTSPGGAVHVGDTVEYTVAAQNQGGSPATLSELRETLPVGVEFVPGSLRATAGPLSGSRSDAAGDDAAEFDTASRQISARLGADATDTIGGSIAPQESVSLVFRAVVTPAASLADLVNAPAVTVTDSLSGNRTTSVAPVVVTPVAPTASLSVVHTADAAPVAGSDRPASFTVGIGNGGPQDDTGVVARVTPPAGLIAPSVTLDGVDCEIAHDGVAECAVGDLGVGAHRSIMVSGLVPETVAVGTVLTSTASVTGDLYDGSPADDSASASATVTTSSDVWVAATSADAPIRIGQDAVFEFTAGNAGPSSVSDLEVAVTMPEGSTVEPSAGSFDAATGQWTIPSLASGAEQTLRVSGPATEAGTMWSRARVLSSSAVDPDPSNEDSTGTVEVALVVPLSPPAPAPSAPAPSAPAAADRAPVAPVAAAPVALAAGLASTGADGDRAVLLAAILTLAGLLLLVARRRSDAARVVARHRA